MTTAVAAAKDRYLAAFEALDRRGAFRSPSWLAPPPRPALDRFAEAGFPTAGDEDWRYTNLTSLAATPFRPAAPSPAGAPAEALERLMLPGVEWARLVFVDGRYSPKLSTARPLPGGGQAASLAEAMITDGDMI